MTLMIELPPDVENRLRHEAAKHGLDGAAYARLLIERQLPVQQPGKSLWETLTTEEWFRAFDAYLAGHDASKPALPPEAFDRAGFYGDRG